MTVTPQVLVPADVFQAALNYIRHVGANHVMRGEPHPQQWIVDGLELAAANQPDEDPSETKAPYTATECQDNLEAGLARLRKQASALSERVPTEIEPRICLAAGCDRQCELGRLFCSSHRAHSSSAISNAAPQGTDRVTAGVATSEPAGAFSPDKQEIAFAEYQRQFNERGEIRVVGESAAWFLHFMSTAMRHEDLSATRDSVIEECAKIIDRKGQDLTNEYCHGDAGPDGYTWTNKEAEWQVILLGELVEEFRALKSSYVKS